MVKERADNTEKVYECESCCLSYKDKKWAEKCEAWCKKHHSCNMKITCYSLESVGKKKGDAK